MRRRCFNALVACALINGVAGVEGAVVSPAADGARGATGAIGVPAADGARGVGGAIGAPAADGARGAGGAIDAPAAVGMRGSAAAVPVPNIDACVSRLDPQLDIGYDRIAARCPELMHQLEGGAWAPWLPRGWKESGNDLSAGSLREFRELVERETDVSGSSGAPDVRRLHTILTTLARSRNENGWSRFKSWLRSILERREEPTDESWLTRMVSHVGVSQSVIRLITYAALTAVVLLAGVIVVNEARTAGLLPGRRRALRKRGELAAAGPFGTSWDDIEQAHPGERPRLLLELIVRRLSDRGFLPPARALTVRELTRTARLAEADDRARLTELALAAERVRYAAAKAQAGGLDGPVARGRELLERLNVGEQGASATRAGGLGAGATAAGGPDVRGPIAGVPGGDDPGARGPFAGVPSAGGPGARRPDAGGSG